MSTSDETELPGPAEGPCPFERDLPLLLRASGESSSDGGAEPSPEEREQLRGHVAACARCGAALEQLEEAARALDAAPVPPPPAGKWARLKADVMARVREGEGEKPATPRAPLLVPAGSPDESSGEGPEFASQVEMYEKVPAFNGAASSAEEIVIAPSPCPSFQQDLVVLEDLTDVRKARVLHHVSGCDECQKARTAFASVASALDAVPLERPPAGRWGTLRADVVAAVGGPASAGKAAALPVLAAKPEPEKRAASRSVLRTKASARTQALLDEASAELEATASGTGKVSGAGKVASSGASASPVATGASAVGAGDPAEAHESAAELKPPGRAAARSEARSDVPGRAEARSDGSGRERVREPLVRAARPLAVEPRRRSSWGLRAAATVLAFLLGGLATQLFRGLGVEGLRAEKARGDAAASPALAIASYELVVREGVGRREVVREVDDALAQLHALHRYERAFYQPDSDAKRVELVAVMAQFPESRAAEFALLAYNKTLEPNVATPAAITTATPVLRPDLRVRKPSGFEGRGFNVNTDEVHQVLEDLTDRYRKLDEIRDLTQREAQRREVGNALAAAHLQRALKAGSVETACLELDRSLEYAEPLSPTAIAARKHLDDRRPGGARPRR